MYICKRMNKHRGLISRNSTPRVRKEKPNIQCHLGLGPSLPSSTEYDSLSDVNPTSLERTC